MFSRVAIDNNLSDSIVSMVCFHVVAQLDVPHEFDPFVLPFELLVLLSDDFPPCHGLENGLFDPLSGDLSSLSGSLYLANDRVADI